MIRQTTLLQGIEQAHCASLRNRMDAAGCVFEFVLLAPEAETRVDEALHRQALQQLHEHLMHGQLEWHRALIQNPEYAHRPPPSMTWEQHRAQATPLAAEQVQRLLRVEDSPQEPLELYHGFRRPPYGTRFKGGEEEARALFHEWCNLLGLEAAEGVQVINWVDGFVLDWQDGDDNPPWSDYFASGLEWWGIWCMTVWNPRRRTLSALVASATD